MAAIGTATGTGLYVLAVLGTILILVVLSLLDRVEAYARRRLSLRPDGYDLAEGAAQETRQPEAAAGPAQGATTPPPSAHEPEPEQPEGELEDLP